MNSDVCYQVKFDDLWCVGFGKVFFKLFCVCLSIEKLVNGKYFPVNEKHFSVKEKIGLVSRKVFFFYFRRKHFPEVVINLEISYYLLIISNLVFKLLIAIYILF
jgi:hypothetical protein